MTRKCKQCKQTSLPPAAKCVEYLEKEGFCCSKCKREFVNAKKEKAALKPKKEKKPAKRRATKITPADKAFADCIKTKANYTCERCGNTERQMHCSHIYSRSHRTVRWAKDNAMCKCSVCHDWWHANPTESGAWFRNLVGEGFYALLTERKNSKVRVSKLEEAEIAKHYREQLKLLQAGAEDFESWQ
jgi:hypothetical protein